MSTKSFPIATNEVAPTSGKFPVVIPCMPSVALKLKVAQSWQPPDKSMYKDVRHDTFWSNWIMWLSYYFQ